MAGGWIARFERGVLFPISRFVAFGICLVLLLGLLVGVVYLLTSSVDMQDRGLDPEDYVAGQQLQEPPRASDAGSAPADSQAPANPRGAVLEGLRIPAVLQELLLEGQNQTWLRQNLDRLPEEQKQSCLDGLGVVWQSALDRGLAAPAEAQAWIEQCVRHSEKLASSRLERDAYRLKAAMVVAGALALVALFALVLVLLAIERNTRPVSAGGRS